MSQHLVFLALGLGNGAVFGALALALVLTYRSSGVINFATGSIALLGAYVYAFLRDGQLLVLIPGLPRTLDLGTQLGLVPAMVIAVAATALLGLVLYLLVFRPLRNAPPVAKAVASLGVSLVITALIAVRMGTTAVAVEPIFATDLWTVGAVRVPADRVYLAVTVLVLAVGLAAAFRFTRFGLVTRAAAESEKGAYLSGVSPDRVAAYNWVISSGIAGLAGILIAPIVPLIPVSYTLFIVPALAAAILSRFQWVFWAVPAGLAIGMLQSEAQYLQTSVSWMPKSGVPELVPLALILLVLVVRARPLPGRGAVIVQTLGRAPRPRRLLLPTVLPAVVAALAVVLLTDQWRNGLISTFIFGVIALSVVVVTGFAGQVSVAQLPLAGTAAFLLAPIADRFGVPFPIAPVLAALGAVVIGVVIGLPALRIRGLTVAVVTLALAFALEALWFRNTALVGADGLTVPSPTLFGLDLGVGAGAAFPRVQFGLLCLVVLAIVAVGVARLRTSRLGSQMLAIRANERAAAAAGVDVVRVKLVAFALGAFIAGIGGALLAYKFGTVTFDPYTAILGLTFFGAVYLAGITSVSGGLLAGVTAVSGIFYTLVHDLLGTGLWYEVIAATLLVLTVIVNPEGIVGPAHALLERRRLRRTAEPLVDPAAAPADQPESPEPEVPAPAADLGEPLLTVRDLTVRYGGVVAVDGFSLDVPRGSIVGLIGPNGAGKTTAIDAISGFAVASGSVSLGGHSLDGLRPHQRIRAGLGRTFQAIELYGDLSVRENVVVGLTARARSHRQAQERLAETLDTLGLTALADRPAGELSQGQRQLVSIARALVGNPQVLLLDEPAGGLDTAESHWLGERLRDLRAAGVTILMVEHDMSLVLSLCDQITVLDFGTVIASGPPETIRTHPRVVEAYLGSAHAEEVSA
ncbi:branched-chain amino acid ABC transporter permease/ATP-binding protein [Cryptosporangium aurantiacum]|uniref:ABC-type branched-chain amino acid transport system, ATPase component n=1 Tax=Cryptosporangium aurantiacum TaxID=134849 RepID=A0A1M7PLT5_9ACTN|nr:branched-chain amino acid ABC transporter permease/ATP-binding protein [Cryptosporangium aurantiacum]SHN18207.1 ABC-type branched-chain amino acid transport system, ATPase component [Cryptosporangium aurantiacum]